MRLWALTILLAGCLAACGSASPARSQTVYIEVGSGTGAIYLVSDSDPSSWPEAAQFASSNSRKVSQLPDGAARVCQYTVSRQPTVEIAVWTTGATSSAELAREECQQLLSG